MLKIEGLDKLQRQLSDATKALEGLDGEVVNVQFDAHDPESIEAAIRRATDEIDSRVSSYAANPFVNQLVEQYKEACRSAILQRAAEARLRSDAP